jgi:uncharacterized protein (TIGR02145 family)
MNSNQMRIVTLIFVISMGLLLCKFGFAEKKKSGTQPEVYNTESKIEPLESATQTDIPTVKIGNQVWMTKNLNVSTFRNGDVIPQAKTQGEWEAYAKTGEPAWCYYDNNPANGDKYGKLYNWYAVNDRRGLAPKGFHVPTDNEWTVLTDYLGGADIAGYKMKTRSGWYNEGNGTNISGFSGLPGGFRYDDGTFSIDGCLGGWWSSSEGSTALAWLRGLGFRYGKVGRSSLNEGNGLSVRCLRD